MVLFLFVIMLMNLNADEEPKKATLLKVSASIAGGMLLLLIVAALKQSSLPPVVSSGEVSQQIGTIKVLGMVLYTQYMLPFEVASILFLIAMVGAVILGKKDTSVPTIGHEEIK